MNVEQIARLLAYLCLGIALYSFILTLLNTLWMRRSAGLKALEKGPSVSILIPARDEEKGIEACLDSLLAQNYENFEIIVYDDDSKDGTAAILDRYAAHHAGTLKVLHGQGLAEGWYGKPQAMEALYKASKGQWLYYTDADTLHNPESIGASIALALRYKADLVSGYVQQRLGSVGEAFVVPAIYLLSMFALPLELIHASGIPALSHAIGQSMLFRKSCIDSLGGFTPIKDRVSEDVRIARLIKRNKGRVLFADLKNRLSCRMYSDYASAIVGLSKNVYDYFGKNPVVLLAATAGISIFLLLPVLASLWLPPFMISVQGTFRLASLAMLATWLLVALDRRLPWYVPLTYPLILINVLSTAWRAARLFSTGRAVEWKGRMVR